MITAGAQNAAETAAGPIRDHDEPGVHRTRAAIGSDELGPPNEPAVDDGCGRLMSGEDLGACVARGLAEAFIEHVPAHDESLRGQVAVVGPGNRPSPLAVTHLDAEYAVVRDVIDLDAQRCEFGDRPRRDGVTAGFGRGGFSLLDEGDRMSGRSETRCNR